MAVRHKRLAIGLSVIWIIIAFVGEFVMLSYLKIPLPIANKVLFFMSSLIALLLLTLYEWVNFPIKHDRRINK